MNRRALAVVGGMTVVLVSVSGSAVTAAKVEGALCLGEQPTIVGTSDSETIRGTAGDDVIVGGGGYDDVIYGRGGDDLICTNPDESRYATILGGGGDDTIRASGDLLGGPGNDTVTNPLRSSATEWLFGGRGDDVLRSRATEDNHFVPGPGDDTLIGARGGISNIADFRTARAGIVVNLRRGTAVGQGHDILTRINTLRGSEHADVFFGDDERYNLMYGRGGHDVLTGRGGWDTLIGGTGDDVVSGGPDNDYLLGGQGSDVLFGRTGNDHLLERRPEPNLIVGGAGRDNCAGGYRVPPSIERGCETHLAG